ncbi:MAG: hypothetical protein EOQ28_13640 [Mesorhizobium sp.]|uniref:hypothetical protein n=1 Tax=Mesorhizobium sp. TaxID=1871066 RepID=UPI000FE41C23|nr:hypothetical protein [Mesorhizobium sp.]RWA74036.1 MAG: hypothetical protein EOQ28_13640 [Mesorhizobium sp.]RWC05162.1 MAG: hypothetical protein EOQ57_01940 [Mesorhizobium sp.]RWK09669.1 MAG: hypothetical protein EOR42_02955 [Mesorhizobium sp.]TIQ45051.1 MAG: hypothetical protein E5X47_27510 [Mesorhizobium sp.]TIQ54614.1 MAG: hypothetical protein E5X46_26625 [Mesorhizobium sp.]
MKKLVDCSPIIVDDSHFHHETTQTDVLLGEWSVIEVADAASALWGDLAVTAIAWGALAANCDGDMPEYRFWFQVFDCLRAGSPETELEGMMAPVNWRSLN